MLIPFKKQKATDEMRKRFEKTKYPREMIYRMLEELDIDEMVGFPVSEVPYSTVRSRVFDFNNKRKRPDGDKRWLRTTKTKEDGVEYTIVACCVLDD